VGEKSLLSGIAAHAIDSFVVVILPMASMRRFMASESCMGGFRALGSWGIPTLWCRKPPAFVASQAATDAGYPCLDSPLRRCRALEVGWMASDLW